MSPVGRPAAFVLLGGFGVVCRNPRYVEELRRRGLEVLLISPRRWRDDALAAMATPGHVAAGIAEASFVTGTLGAPESFTSEVLAQAMRWSADYELHGVYAVGEVLVEQAGVLADALGLCSPGLRATRVCRSKVLQRWYLRDLSPACHVVAPSQRSSVAGLELAFPVVVKPASRHSSSGVRTCPSLSALLAAVDGFPATETVLVEERVVGPEFSVESLVQGGEVLFESVTAKATTESHAATFVELAHSVPAVDRAAGAVLPAANRDVLRRLAFADGVAHSEWRLGPDGTPVLMEIAARTPGDGLMPLYELATGRPMEPEIVRICLGEPAAYDPPRRFARQVYLEHEEGRLDDVRVGRPGVEVAWVGPSGVWPHLPPGRPDDDPALRGVLVLQDRGSLLPPLGDSDDRAVTFLLDAPTAEGLDALEAEVRASISIDVTPAGGAA